ncbi:phosphatase PAP2 family protein [Candidatus Uhrbacteria bacterium]|nr:phosphatase PAP2 family protein [Candidatus Uhrbacteria bacterium]
MRKETLMGFRIVVSVIAAIFFIFLAISTTYPSWVVQSDRWAVQWMRQIQSPALTTMMTIVTDLLGPVTGPLFTLFLVLWFLPKQWQTSALIIVALGGGFILETLFKLVIARPRPPVEGLLGVDYSFPSGHATIATIFFLLLIVLFGRAFRSPIVLGSFIIVNITIALLVGFSRIYLGVHWASDVLAGTLLGIGWLSLLLAIFGDHIRDTPAVANALAGRRISG